jgi:hypothetical protein
MRTLLLALVMTVPASANLLDAIRTRTGLQRDTPCGYETLFAGGTASVPCGKTRGTVLHVCGGHPKFKAHLQSGVWKGKTFTPCGITNRWLLGVSVIKTEWHFEDSRIDGKPCLVMEYAAGTPVFGGQRDEVREIRPGVWLGRCTDATTGELKNWFLLQAR